MKKSILGRLMAVVWYDPIFGFEGQEWAENGSGAIVEWVSTPGERGIGQQGRQYGAIWRGFGPGKGKGRSDRERGRKRLI